MPTTSRAARPIQGGSTIRSDSFRETVPAALGEAAGREGLP